MTDELRDQIAEAVLNFFGRDGAPTDTEQALAFGAADRVMVVVEPRLSEAMAEAEQLRGAFEVAARALRSDVETKAERARCAEAAIERATVALTNALLVWQPEHEYRLERVRRKGDGADEVAVGVLGEAIKVASGVLAALSPAGGSERCPSCDHLTNIHQPDGCWYTVKIGTVDRDLVCPCSVPQGRLAGGSEETKEDPKAEWAEKMIKHGTEEAPDA